MTYSTLKLNPGCCIRYFPGNMNQYPQTAICQPLFSSATEQHMRQTHDLLPQNL